MNWEEYKRLPDYPDVENLSVKLSLSTMTKTKLNAIQARSTDLKRRIKKADKAVEEEKRSTPLRVRNTDLLAPLCLDQQRLEVQMSMFARIKPKVKFSTTVVEQIVDITPSLFYPKFTAASVELVGIVLSDCCGRGFIEYVKNCAQQVIHPQNLWHTTSGKLNCTVVVHR